MECSAAGGAFPSSSALPHISSSAQLQRPSLQLLRGFCFRSSKVKPTRERREMHASSAGPPAHLAASVSMPSMPSGAGATTNCRPCGREEGGALD